ncbi:MAG: nucleotide exchange factor GrpE [Oscillospiraceae bacterium]|nr:nucleotide exchange factor GrpE [Oscillospiraceae bacterium]
MSEEKKTQAAQEAVEEVLNEEASAETQAGQPEEQQPDPVAELQKELDETKDRLMRTLAEYDNFRKRTQKEREGLFPEAEAGVLTRFLPFMDNFERAMQAECADPDFKKGMEMIYQSFCEIFSSMGVEPIGNEGETFDPNLHNAVMHEENPDLGENVVSMVLQKGWKRGEKILRYAMVKTAN